MITVAVIPTLDEEQAIGHVIDSLPRPLVTSVIVVDGGSTDDTVGLATRAGATVIDERRPGYGRACLTGAEAAAGADVILFLDGDGADVGEQAGRLVVPVLEDRYDLVLGSRVRGRREPGSIRLHQLTGNRLVAAVLNRRFGLSLSDIGPYRAIRAEVLRGLDLSEMTYGWPTQMIRNAAARGHRVAEVPVDYRRRIGGKSKVSGNPGASVRAGWDMVRVAAR